MLIPPAQELFFSKNDSADPRMGEICFFKRLDSDFSEEYTLIGYPDDEGISLNQGRKGSALAPDKIREYFYKMTPDLFSEKNRTLADLGNLEVSKVILSERHQQAKQHALNLLKKNKKLISLGGGHDYAYCDGAAFIEAFKGQNPLIINIDAHLDVRNTNNGFNSGTAFYRLLSEYKNDFELIELGIQNQCNSKTHFNWAKAQGAKVISLEQIELVGLFNSIFDLIKDPRPCYLSVDIDGFSSTEAPGCSQSWTSGIRFQEFNQFLVQLNEKVKLQSIGIYEVSPPLDSDHRTSKLAALILHRFLFL
jgi:formiminoglutamase